MTTDALSENWMIRCRWTSRTSQLRGSPSELRMVYFRKIRFVNGWELGVPRNHPFLDGCFPFTKTLQLLGYPKMTMETPKWMRTGGTPMTKRKTRAFFWAPSVVPGKGPAESIPWHPSRAGRRCMAQARLSARLGLLKRLHGLKLGQVCMIMSIYMYILTINIYSLVKQKSTVEFSMVLPAKNLQILQNVRVLPRWESLCSGKSMISFACFACFHLPIASVVQNVNRNSNFPAESGCAQMIYLQNRMVEKIKSDLTWVCPFTVHKRWSLKYCSYISPIFGWLKIGLNVHDGPFFSGSHLHDPTAFLDPCDWGITGRTRRCWKNPCWIDRCHQPWLGTLPDKPHSLLKSTQV